MPGQLRFGKGALCVLAMISMISMSGCVETREYGPSHSDMEIQLFSEYQGDRFGDSDNSLFVVAEWPNIRASIGVVQSYGIPGPAGMHSGILNCVKNHPDFKDKPWWMEVSLYTDNSKQVLVDRVRVEPADCYAYSGEIEADGTLTIYPGYPEWHGDSKPYLTTLGRQVVIFGSMGLVGAAIIGIIVWRKLH